MTNHYILVYINGKPFNCKSNLLLKDLLDYLEISTDSNVVEYNSQIVQDISLNKIILYQGDKIEILTIVGGG